MAKEDTLLTLEDLDLYLLAHTAIRQDLTRFTSQVPHLSHSGGGQKRSLAMGEWFERLCALLAQHHRGEDDSIFPLLVERDSGWASHEAELAADHAKLDPLLDRVSEGFRRLSEAA